MLFEWDEKKNAVNIAKHGVSFVLAQKIFDSPILTREDARKSYGESRRISIGVIGEVAFLVVVHTDRSGVY